MFRESLLWGLPLPILGEMDENTPFPGDAAFEGALRPCASSSDELARACSRHSRTRPWLASLVGDDPSYTLSRSATDVVRASVLRSSVASTCSLDLSIGGVPLPSSISLGEAIEAELERDEAAVVSISQLRFEAAPPAPEGVPPLSAAGDVPGSKQFSRELRQLSKYRDAIVAAEAPERIPEETLLALSRLLRDLSLETFSGGKGAHAGDDAADRRRLLLAQSIGPLVEILPRVPIEGFRSGCEHCIQLITNLLRSRRVKIIVASRHMGEGGVLDALHERLQRGGLDDCNICIKAARCITTLVWTDDRPVEPAYRRHVIRAGLLEDLQRSALQHSQHEFTLYRSLDSLVALWDSFSREPQRDDIPSHWAPLPAFVSLVKAIGCGKAGPVPATERILRLTSQLKETWGASS
jgi:hypothetical protein